MLFDIQDQIAQLKDEIHNKDTETIQAIVRAGQQTAPVEDSDTAILKILLPELLKNPKSMASLLELSDRIDQSNSSKNRNGRIK